MGVTLSFFLISIVQRAATVFLMQTEWRKSAYYSNYTQCRMNGAVFHDLCSVSSAAIDVIKVCDEEDIHTLELKTLYHYLTQIGFQHGIKSLRKTLNDTENYAKRIETYITDQEVCNET